jgi:hypothetical protein
MKKPASERRAFRVDFLPVAAGDHPSLSHGSAILLVIRALLRRFLGRVLGRLSGWRGFGRLNRWCGLGWLNRWCGLGWLNRWCGLGRLNRWRRLGWRGLHRLDTLSRRFRSLVATPFRFPRLRRYRGGGGRLGGGRGCLDRVLTFERF